MRFRIRWVQICLFKCRRDVSGLHPLRNSAAVTTWKADTETAPEDWRWLSEAMFAKSILTIRPTSTTLSLKCTIQRCLRVTMFSCKDGFAGWKGSTTDLCPGRQKPSRRHCPPTYFQGVKITNSLRTYAPPDESVKSDTLISQRV